MSLVHPYGKLRKDIAQRDRAASLQQEADRLAVEARELAARREGSAADPEAARRAAAFLALPQNAPLAARLLFATVDAMWRTAGEAET